MIMKKLLIIVGLAIVACTPINNPEGNSSSLGDTIQLVHLDSLNKSLLDEVFCDYNLKLRDLKEDSVYIIRFYVVIICHGLSITKNR